METDLGVTLLFSVRDSLIWRLTQVAVIHTQLCMMHFVQNLEHCVFEVTSFLTSVYEAHANIRVSAMGSRRSTSNGHMELPLQVTEPCPCSKQIYHHMSS